MVMKKILHGLFSIILLLLLFKPTIAASQSYFFSNVTIDTTINEDGSIDWIEKRTFSFTGSFSRVYWDIPLTGNQTINNVSVSDSNNMLYTQLPDVDEKRPVEKFAAVRQGNNEHIEAYHSSYDETKTFILSYHLTGAITKYEDVGEFYWKVIGDQWGARTDHATITVHLPQIV